MAETSKRAEMAKKVFDEIFAVFGWTRRGTLDRNWTCVNQGVHEKKTHPTDMVCTYDDPYRNESVFVNVDLKSFKADSIDKTQVTKALRSLALATECLNQSQEWQEAYVDGPANWSGVSLLFVYNNDRSYDESRFAALYRDIDLEELMSPGRRMFVLGPGEVNYLYAVANDIARTCHKQKCEHSFYYPDLVRHLTRPQNSGSASLEILTGPWQIVRLTASQKQRGKHNEEYIVYYRGAGRDVNEFVYLIDFLFRFQILREATKIHLRVPSADDIASEVWQRAKIVYGAKYPSLESVVENRLANVTFASVSTVLAKLSEIELGMD